MTAEQKAKAYDEALQRARELNSGKDVDVEAGITTCEYIFPELKDSEDEKIRKELIDAIQGLWANDALPMPLSVKRKDSWIAWLEKQGKQEPISITDEWIEDYWQHEKIINMDSYDKGEEIQFDHYGFVNFCKRYCKKPVERNEEDESIRKELMDFIYVTCFPVKDLKKKERFLDWLEKQGKQPTDKVEPKFKVGDWVVSNNTGEVWQIGTSYTEKGQRLYLYNVNDVIMSITLDALNNVYHLWTIADAKDGDVLVASDGSIFLFAGVDDCACEYYVALTTDNYLKINKEVKGGYWETSRAVYPATKEQRDLLFQKMADAGYEWDSEKKELKKVEPEFHEGDWVGCEVTGSAYQIKNCSESLNNHKFGYGLTNGGYIGSDEVNLYHLWTIQDAKDGDVVVDKSDGTIGIFQSIGHHPDGGSYNDPSYCFLYCRYDDGFFYADFEHGNTINSNDLIPATKEQRDLLFAKMKEAGYEWNGEKKELNKIKPKTLDADKVIAWLRQHSCAACCDNPDEGVSQRIEQFKKDFEI